MPQCHVCLKTNIAVNLLVFPMMGDTFLIMWLMLIKPEILNHTITCSLGVSVLIDG